MFPFFEPYPWVIIYSFWLTLVVCFFLFLWMLKRLGIRHHYDSSVFTRNILWYFLSIFIFSRLFYVISKWNDLKYIKNPYEFFIMSGFNFSLVGAIIWFFAILFLNFKFKKEKITKYIDAICLSFLFILVVWYVWAFLWWQVYGRETYYGIEVVYTHAFTPIPFQVPIFPLPIVYSLAYFLLFSLFYILSLFVTTRWLLGYLGFISFAAIQLILEFFSWKTDIFKNTTGMNINQLFSIIIIIVCIQRLYLLFKNNK